MNSSNLHKDHMYIPSFPFLKYKWKSTRRGILRLQFFFMFFKYQCCYRSVIGKHLRVFLRFLLAIPSLKIRKINNCADVVLVCKIHYPQAEKFIPLSVLLPTSCILHPSQDRSVNKKQSLLTRTKPWRFAVNSYSIYFLRQKNTNVLVSH